MFLLSDSKRQKSVFVGEMDFSVELEQMRVAGRNRNELALMHSRRTHLYLHNRMIRQNLLRTGKKRIKEIKMFDPITLKEKTYRVKIDENGRIPLKKDFKNLGLKKGTPVDVLLELPSFKEKLSSLSYIESNRIISKLPAIEQITTMTMRMAAENQANKKAKKEWAARKRVKLSKKKKVVSKKKEIVVPIKRGRGRPRKVKE